MNNDSGDKDKNGTCDATDTVTASFEFNVCRNTGTEGPARGDCDTMYMSTSALSF